MNRDSRAGSALRPAGRTDAAGVGAERRPPGNAPDFGASYLAFRVGRQEFAVPAGLVRHMISNPEILPVGDSLPFLVGLVRAGGRSIPLFSLRARLGTCDGAWGGKGAALVIEVPGEAGPQTVGLLVDKFLGAERYRPSEMRASGGAGVPVTGIARTKGRSRLILDVSVIFAPEHWRGCEPLCPGSGQSD